MPLDLPHLVQRVVVVCHQAGSAILDFYGRDTSRLGVRSKQDKSLLTEADLAANQIILSGLSALPLKLPILSEEGAHFDYETRRRWHRYWITDPLDGTQGFTEGSEEFTVNVALIEDGRPVLGVIYAPVPALMYYGYDGGGAYKQVSLAAPQPIKTSQLDWRAYRVVLGRHVKNSNLLDFYEQQPFCTLLRCNSSLKLGEVAEGTVDFYPRLGETGEWDTAAGQCILEAAGGTVVDLEGQPLRYNTQDTLINPPFVALGDRSQKKQIINFLLEKRRRL